MNQAVPPEVLALAKAGNTEELSIALKELGLPPDYCAPPVPGELPDEGEVSLSTSEPPGVVQCSYRVLKGDVMVIDGALGANMARELIHAAELVGSWRQGTQVKAGKTNPAYVSDSRTSMNLHLSGGVHRFLARFEAAVRTLAHEAGRFYQALNPHVTWSRDMGWEIMRYEEGQEFDLHVDHIPGHAGAQQRQLSVLIYLNDDFEGGETEFPRQGICLRQPSGTIALFPPWPTHPHHAKPVTKGVKYAVVGWLYS